MSKFIVINFFLHIGHPERLPSAYVPGSLVFLSLKRHALTFPSTLLQFFISTSSCLRCSSNTLLGLCRRPLGLMCVCSPHVPLPTKPLFLPNSLLPPSGGLAHCRSTPPSSYLLLLRLPLQSLLYLLRLAPGLLSAPLSLCRPLCCATTLALPAPLPCTRPDPRPSCLPLPPPPPPSPPCGTPCRVPNLFIISALCRDARGMLTYTPPRSGYKWAAAHILPARPTHTAAGVDWTQP